MARTYRNNLYFATLGFDDHRYEAGELICSSSVPMKEGDDSTYHHLEVFKTSDHTDEWGNYIPVVDIRLMGNEYRLDEPLDIPWSDGGNLRIQIGWDLDDNTLTEIEIFVESAPIPIDDEEEDC